jgi:hypothetical protein
MRASASEEKPSQIAKRVYFGFSNPYLKKRGCLSGLMVSEYYRIQCPSVISITRWAAYENLCGDDIETLHLWPPACAARGGDEGLQPCLAMKDGAHLAGIDGRRSMLMDYFPSAVLLPRHPGQAVLH